MATAVDPFRPGPKGSGWIAELPTPCLLLDRGRVQRNIERMHARLRALGVPLRPHVKTAKCAEIAQLLIAGQPGGIAVSTLAEARFFLGHGFRDILYAVGIAPQRLPAVEKLVAAGAQLSILVDGLDAAHAVARYVRALGFPLGVLIEIDTDGHRAGVQPDDAVLTNAADVLAAVPGIEMRGVLTHAGGSYACDSVACIRQIAQRERDGAVYAAQRLRERGHSSPVVSVGSTPTATFAQSLAQVTEVRAGVFVFHDLVMAGLGVCRIDELALTVLTTVIGSQRSRNWIVVDSGWMALSRDRGTARQRIDQFYGVVCDETGEPLDELVVRETNQEHGVIARRDGGPIDLRQFPIGRRLRVLPNHACATAAAHDRYHVIGDNEVIGEWHRCGGWY